MVNHRLGRVVLGALIFLLLGAYAGYPKDRPPAEIIWGGQPHRRAVALTFDDGPASPYTGEILALLKEYGAKATFFVMGARVEQYPHLIKAMLEGGHEVGNHTYSHPRLPNIAKPVWIEELERTRLALDMLGCPSGSRLVRPPYSAYDERLAAYLRHTGRSLVLWGLDSGDWQGLGAGTIAHNVLSRVKNGSIIIFHDSDAEGRASRRATVEALEMILPALKKTGYAMVTISELCARRPR
jgi:peptidoglycan/xylan/chitin deacetylase (PgdA/CDA1 family)